MAKMKKKPSTELDENEVLQEVKKTEKKVNKAPLKELPDEELTLDDKLFEIKKTIETSRTQTINGLKHLEKKIDFIYNMLSGKVKKR